MVKEDFYKTLPRKRTSSGAIFLNKKGEILIVKPTYKEYWTIPGGCSEAGESPRATCIREVREEIGLGLKNPKLICVDYILDKEIDDENINFLYDGGVLNEKDIASIVLQKSELGEWKYISVEEAVKLFNTRMARRIPLCVEAVRSGKTIYLEEARALSD